MKHPKVLVVNDDTTFLELMEQLLDLITLDPDTSSIPVIVASANLQALAARDDELAQKGIYVLAKPFDIDELASLIRRALARTGGPPD